MNGQVPQTDLAELLPGIIKKPWGHEKILEKNELYVVKELYVRAGQKLSLQYHKRKIETLFLVSGQGFVEVGSVDERCPERLNPIFIDRKVIHRISAGALDCLFVEVSSTQLNDVVRLQDDYDRA